jgi:hypothetical protein
MLLQADRLEPRVCVFRGTGSLRGGTNPYGSVGPIPGSSRHALFRRMGPKPGSR